MSDRVALAVDRWARYRETNALLATRPEAAAADLAAARERGARLAGWLFSVKDVYLTAGTVTTAGSLVLDGWVPDRDAVAVARLREAGAALFGKGHCAEFGFGVTQSATRIGGAVRHPWDEGLSVGGSSGGDAVAVATGIVDVALAGDYGGSVRWPAQSVGICGLRTSAGTVPRTGRIPGGGAVPGDPAPGPPDPRTLGGMLETVGIMARSVAEIAEVTAAVAGPDGRDWRGAGAVPLARGPFRRRLACSAAPEVGPVDDEAAEAVRRVVQAAQAAGFETIDATGVLAGAFECYSELRAALDDHADLRRLVAGREGLLCPGTAAALSAPRPPAQHAGASSLAARWARARAATDRVTRLLRAVDALVVPVAASGPLPAGTAAGRPRPDNELMAHCRAVSLTGLPALSVPVTGPDRPVSVQVVGPPGGDLRCCEVAALIGDQLGQAWARPPVAPGG